MIGALAEIASGRKLFIDTYDRKTKETKVGIMQVAPEVAQWLGKELGYKRYDIEDNTNLLYWPLVNVYFGAAYAKWLFSCDDKYAFHLVHCVLLILSSPISQQLECNYILQMLQTKNGRICC